MSQFQDKVVLVTGSGRGIGRTVALRFAQLGAHIVVNFFRNRNPAEKTAEEIRALGVRALVVKANVGSIDELAGMFAEIETTFAGLDIYIHNAASGYNRGVLEQKPKGWDWTMNINARSLLFAAQHAVPLMEKQGGGAIIAISSLGSERVIPDYVAVGASKAALETLVRYLGVELAGKKIVVNAVSPGLVDTDALRHFASFEEYGQEVIKEVDANTPAGRLVTRDDVADIVCFLASSQAKMICGQTIVLDGGYSLRAWH